MIRPVLLLLAAALLAAGEAEAPGFVPAAPLSGRIVSIGSSTVSNLVHRWGDDLARVHPDAAVEITGGGSTKAPEALAAGRSQLAPMTRAMTPAELAAVRAGRRREPTGIIVALDALAVLVHRDNPIEALSLVQLDAIYGAERRRGHRPADRWGDVDLAGAWAQEPLVVYGPSPLQGSYQVITELVLQGGRFRLDLAPSLVASELAQNVGVDRGGIAFSTLYYANKRTRVVPLRRDDGTVVAPTPQTCADGSYPLARPLWLYVDAAPGSPPPPLVAEWLRYALSREGQRAVAAVGMFPLPEAMAARERAKLATLLAR